MGRTIPEFEGLRTNPCILSNEAGLLRLGGISQAGKVAKAIAQNFSDPVLLLTIRDQVALLRSAYFQSEAVRQRVMGFADGKYCTLNQLGL